MIELSSHSITVLYKGNSLYANGRSMKEHVCVCVFVFACVCVCVCVCVCEFECHSVLSFLQQPGISTANPLAILPSTGASGEQRAPHLSRPSPLPPPLPFLLLLLIPLLFRPSLTGKRESHTHTRTHPSTAQPSPDQLSLSVSILAMGEPPFVPSEKLPLSPAKG